MKPYKYLIFVLIVFLISISCTSFDAIFSFFSPTNWDQVGVYTDDQNCETLTIGLYGGGKHSHVYVDEIKFSCSFESSYSDDNEYICTGHSSSLEPTLTVKIYEYSSLDSLRRTISHRNLRSWDICDFDSDGAVDSEDGCPSDPEIIICDCEIGDTDSDGDNLPDCVDLCPGNPGKAEPGRCGCEFSDADTDLDGMPDCLDECPEDPDKEAPEYCGCGVAETDSDGDFTPDCVDTCLDNPEKTEPGICGCELSDLDEDEDGFVPCRDICPGDAWHDGIGDPCNHDEDGDGSTDDVDGCPFDPRKTSRGLCGCGKTEASCQ